MAKLNRLLQPGQVESAFSHLNENLVMGALPGQITDVNDPEKIGRVRVRCPLIDPNNDLPNNQGGWIPFLEKRTLNAAAGGEHTLLEPGTLVLLMPIGGDITNSIILGCLPNREDPPHPETDRSKGTYGSVTSGQVFEINNDAEASQLKVWPHGVLKSVSSRGDITHQTEAGARTQITHDGNLRMENQYAFSAITSNGTVTQKSAKGAILNLHEDGTADLTNSSKASIRLDGVQAKMAGPMSELAGLFQQGGKVLGGVLGKMKGLLGEVKNIAGALASAQTGGEIGTVIVQAHALFQKLSAQVKEIPTGIAALNKLTQISNQDIGTAISSQIHTAIQTDLGAVTKVIQSALKNPIESIPTIVEEIQKALPADWKEKNTPKLIQGLQSFKEIGSSLEIQTQAVLENFFPGDINQISGLIDLGLHTVFEDLQTQTSEGIDLYQKWVLAKFKYDLYKTNNPLILPSETLADEMTQARDTLNQNIQSIVNLLPDAVHRLLGDTAIHSSVESALSEPDGFNGIVSLMSSVATNGIEQANVHLESTLALSDPIVPLGDLFGSIKTRNVGGVQNSLQALSNLPGMPQNFKFTDGDIDGWLEKHGSELIQKGLNDLESQISELVQGGLDKILKLSNFVPPETATAVVRALPALVEAYTGLGGAGGRLEIAGTSAALLGPFNTHQVFAGIRSAGIKTPYGTFGLGAGGASIFSQGAMLLRAASLGSNLAHGISLSPQGALLSAFFDATRWNDETHSPQASATIGASGNQVVMQSLDSNGNIHHGIVVSPDGIFLNDFDATDLSLFGTKIAAVEKKIEELFALIPPTP